MIVRRYFHFCFLLYFSWEGKYTARHCCSLYEKGIGENSMLIMKSLTFNVYIMSSQVGMFAQVMTATTRLSSNLCPLFDDLGL